MKEKILIVEDQFVEADYLRVMLTEAGYTVNGIARSVLQAQEMIEKERPDFVLLDIFLKGNQTGIDLAKQLTDDNIAFVYLSANSNEEVLTAATATQPYGFLVKPFRKKDLLVTLEVAKYRHEHSLESKYRREAKLQKQLNGIHNNADAFEQKLLKIASILQPYIPFDYMAIGFNNMAALPFNSTSFLRIGFNDYQVIGLKELSTITGKSLNDILQLEQNDLQEEKATIYDAHQFENNFKRPSLRKLVADSFQMKSHFVCPLNNANKNLAIYFYSRRQDVYSAAHTELPESITTLLAKVMVNVLLDKANLTDDLHQKRTDKINDAGTLKAFDGIIGKSHHLLNVFDYIMQVAPSDTSVLILGESGTGKEKIADCIHNLSPRKGKPFVKINCATLPATLIESELFGHEKGAFTGAIEKRIGKFEMARNGTIFLDEIGEMPIELQVKLLRVLQEKEIEPIGSKGTVKIDVRIIAATNRNLEKEVAEGRFRLDLYYRLNVFPVTLPALRDREEDIPMLAYHFMDYYNRKAGKKIAGISDNVLKMMMAHSWPGNIRELENLMERSVLLAKGTTIEDISIPVILKKTNELGNEPLRTKTIHENEREYIMAVLKKCNGRIWGTGGAAEILSLPPSTLKSRMKKLGIKKEYIE